ncbi:MAG TPA: class I SAM-dependent methyltransferase [Herpetosiphonaceae bacterium]
MTSSVRDYYDYPSAAKIGAQGAGLIWFLGGRDHLSPSYNNHDEIALDSRMWRAGASRRCLRLVHEMAIAPGALVLDFGSGIGGPGRDIHATTGARVVGINLSRQQLKTSLALSLLQRPAEPLFADLVNADGQSLPFCAQSFEHVYSINMFYHIPAPEQALSEIARVLRPGGRFGLDDWFLTERTSTATRQNLRTNWSSPQGFHRLSDVRLWLEQRGLLIVKELDFTDAAGQFLSEERFGAVFDRQVRARLIEVFPQLYQYEGYIPEHAALAAEQLRSDILYMGQLYRSGEAVYTQLIAEKRS